eukprot:3780418-Pleurochrysis_carterae.AAC.3
MCCISRTVIQISASNAARFPRNFEFGTRPKAPAKEAADSYLTRRETDEARGELKYAGENGENKRGNEDIVVAVNQQTQSQERAEAL